MPSDPQVPDRWRIVRLGDVANVARGASWSREQESSVPRADAMPVVRIGNVQSDGFRMADTIYIRDVPRPERIRRAITSRTLVMVGSNGNRDRVGNTFLSNDEVIGHLLASFLIAIEPIETVSERFLAALLRSAPIQSRITGATAGSTGLKNLSLKWLRSLTLLLPPLNEQRAIAAVLDSIDEAIERTEEVIAATERLRDALLHDLLTRGLPGRHTEWREVPGLGTIPACWDVVRLGDVAEVVMGQSPPGPDCNRTGDGDPLLNGPTEFGPVHPTPAQWTNTSTRIALPGDLLFCVRGATVGRTNWADRKYVIGRGIATIRHHAGSEYQAFVGALIEFRMPRLLGAVAGSTFPNLSSSELSDLSVGRPPMSEQQAIARAISQVNGAIDRLRQESMALSTTTASSAQSLLTGTSRLQAGRLRTSEACR